MDFGSRLSEFVALYSDSPWLDRLLTVEAIRLACIPYRDNLLGEDLEYTPSSASRESSHFGSDRGVQSACGGRPPSSSMWLV